MDLFRKLVIFHIDLILAVRNKTVLFSKNLFHFIEWSLPLSVPKCENKFVFDGKKTSKTFGMI